jgi:dUTP pyrophosphatase
MQEDVALWLMPKSGLGFKYHMQLMNTIGLVDADYYNSDNEGHIMLKISTDDMQQSCGCHSSDDSSNKEKYVPEYLQEGKKIIQGVFLKYYTTSDDDQTDFQTRNGGFGSTGE